MKQPNATLITKGGLFYVGILPEKPICYCYDVNGELVVDHFSRIACDNKFIKYESDLKTALESAILVEDQEEARRIINDFTKENDSGIYNHIYTGIPVPAYKEVMQFVEARKFNYLNTEWLDFETGMDDNVTHNFKYRTIARFLN